MNHWRNEALSKIFFFLIAGPRLIRLKDKGKLIKYVDIWSLFVSLWSKFWNAAIWLDFPLWGSLVKREHRWKRADGLAMWVNDWPLSISSSPEATVVRGAHVSIRKAPPRMEHQWFHWRADLEAFTELIRRHLALQTQPAQRISP